MADLDLTATGAGRAPAPLAEQLVHDEPGARRFRVHRASMVLPEVFEAERRRIFDAVWLYLGHESEVPRPGDFRLRTLVGRPLIYCRDSAGRIHAFLNSCPHRGSMVCREPAGNRKVFQCMYHAWTFADDGRLLSRPGEDGYAPGGPPAELGLRPVPRLEAYKGFVFVSFNPTVQSLPAYLGGVTTYLDAIVDQSEAGLEVRPGTQLYGARANWKLLVENSFDVYHVPALHPTYMAYLKAQGTDVSGGVRGNTVLLGNGHGIVVSVGPWGRPIARWEQRWGPARKQQLAEVRARMVARHGEERARLICDLDFNMVVFPNLVINDIMGTVIRQVNPVAPDAIELTQWSLGPVDETPEDRELRLKSFLTFLGPGGLATPDDVEATEACQRGFASWRELPWSDMSRGYAEELAGDETAWRGDLEIQLRAFWRAWRDWMTGRLDPAGRPAAAAAAR